MGASLLQDVENRGPGVSGQGITIVPADLLREDGDVIPDDRPFQPSRADGGITGCADGGGQGVGAVPELEDARVGKAGECCSAGRSPVGGEDRLPDDENFDPGITDLVEFGLQCGGPPQTFASSGGEHGDYALFSSGGIEGIPQFPEVDGFRRGLSGRGAGA